MPNTPKTNKMREEPKINMDDLEEELDLYKKKWPRDEGLEEKGEGEESEENHSGDNKEIAGVLEHPCYREMQEKLTRMEAKADEYKNQQLRDQAELNNIIRRVERDKANAYKFALEEIAKDLLVVVDNMDSALANVVSDNEFAKKIHEGIELTRTSLLKILGKHGVKQINPMNEVFNPELHQAIATREADVEPNTVVEVLQKGYLLNDRLIRPALVVVSTT